MSRPRHSITETPALAAALEVGASTDLAATVEALAPLGSLP
jgi:hypothetical protein